MKKDKAGKKKKYTKPEIYSEKVFEVAALACGKCIGSGPFYQPACNLVKKKS